MVAILLPPPRQIPEPLIFRLPVGTRLLRIFTPGRHGVTALTFREFGPKARFDHHRGTWDGRRRRPDVDPDRRIYYATLTLSSCLAECFGDTGIIELRRQQIAMPILSRDLAVLDLRGPGAMRAGTTAAIAKVADRLTSQAWARYFYECPAVYTEVDGLIYANAHNDEAAMALFERAENALACPPQRVLPLDHSGLRPAIQQAALDNNLFLA